MGRILSAMRRLGPKGFVAKAVRRTWQTHIDIVLVRDLTHAAPTPSRETVTIKPFEGNDESLLRRASRMKGVNAAFNAKLQDYARSGYRALFAEIDGVIAGYVWWIDGAVSRDRIHPQLLRFEILLEPEDAWAFDFFVAPEYRGGGTSSEFLSKFEVYLGSLGFARVWGFVAADNKPARWLYSLFDWKPRKVVRSIELLRRLLISQTGLYLKNSRRRRTRAHDYRQLVHWQLRR